jgi:reactive intermediate/imine deaminase
MTLKKRQLIPSGFTPALGSYSHGIETIHNDVKTVFVTGQIAMDKDGNVVAPGNPQKQTEFVFENISLILAEADMSLDDVVKAQIFLTDINDFSKVSLIRNRYFEKSKPVSTLVEVSKLVKDGCIVEIEVIAMKNISPSEK